MTFQTSASWHDVTAFYDHLTLHVVPGPRSISYFFPYVLMVITLVTPPQILSHKRIQWLVVPTIYAIQVYVWAYHRSFDVISMNGALMVFMLLGWYDVRRDFRYVKRIVPEQSSQPRLEREASGQHSTSVTTDKLNEQTKLKSESSPKLFKLEPYPGSFGKRLTWVGILFASMRMTDWQIGMSSHDRKQPDQIKPLAGFILETVSQAMLAYVLLDFTSPYAPSIVCESNSVALTGQYLQAQVVRAVSLLAYVYAALALFTALLPHLISVCALLVVPSLRSNPLASPLTWPSHFGPVSSIYSRPDKQPQQNLGLRAFWGVFWHQNMRFITSTPGVALASLLDLKKGSKTRYYLIVMSSFFWSGVVHMGVVPPEPNGTQLGCWAMRLRVASFFWVQTIGIVAEDVIQDVRGDASNMRNGTEKKETTPLTASDGADPHVGVQASGLVAKSCILLWTIGFLAFTAWWTVLPVACEMGWLNLSLAPVSVIQRLNFLGVQ